MMTYTGRSTADCVDVDPESSVKLCAAGIENGVLAVDVLVCRVEGGEKDWWMKVWLCPLEPANHRWPDRMTRPSASPQFDLRLLERSFDDVQSEAGTEVAAANCWNPLPNEVKNAESLASFRRQLKTHLFKQAFLI